MELRVYICAAFTVKIKMSKQSNVLKICKKITLEKNILQANYM